MLVDNRWMLSAEIESLLRRCCQVLENRFENYLEAIFLTGSFALGTADDYSDIDLIVILSKGSFGTLSFRVDERYVEAFVYEQGTLKIRLDDPDDRRNPSVLLLPHLPLIDKQGLSFQLRREAFVRLFNARDRPRRLSNPSLYLLRESAMYAICTVSVEAVERVSALDHLVSLGLYHLNMRSHRWTTMKMSHSLWDMRVNFPRIGCLCESLLCFATTSAADILEFMTLVSEIRPNMFSPRAIDLSAICVNNTTRNAFRRLDLTAQMLRTYDACRCLIDCDIEFGR